MKYQNLKSFQKQLSSAAPHLLCRHYLIALGDDFERAKAFDAVLAYLPVSPNRLSAANTDLRGCLDAMQNMNLFGESVVVIDEIEKLSKKELQVIGEQLSLSSGFVLLGTRFKLTSLVNVVEKEGIVLDLLDEKPWDKEKRISETLIERAKKGGKFLGSDAVSILFERLGVDLALLESEVDKLICYVGDRTLINRDDILAISPMSKGATLWQIAEEVIWEGGDVPPLDATSFHTLIPALRSQLHIGLCLATLIAEKRPSDEWGQFLPKLWPKTLEKRSSQAARLGADFFQKGLEKLFEIELISRSHSTQYGALLEPFRASIYVS